MNNWNRIFKPIVVLGVICVIVTGALAATNGVTAPIIQAATGLARPPLMRMAALPPVPTGMPPAPGLVSPWTKAYCSRTSTRTVSSG